MPINTRHIIISLVYSLVLSAIYATEMVGVWGYMGFHGDWSIAKLLATLAVTAGLASIVPSSRDTREATIIAIHYLFYLPTVVFLIFSNSTINHYFAFAITVGFIWVLSGLNLKAPAFKSITLNQTAVILFFSTLFACLIQASFGGLTYFNIDLERVYEFRRAAAAELPPIFGYLYSNVASVMIPLSLVIAIRVKNRPLILANIAVTIFLFGMTHHKSVLFGPPAILLIYILLQKIKSTRTLGLIFLGIPVLCGLELIYYRLVAGSSDPAYLTSILARRLLFVPTMLDGRYVEFFSDNSKYWWSASRIGSWATENPYGVAAPFLIGEEFFGDTDMSANAGIIASGFSNAGLFGVAIYAALAGLLIGLLNSFGKRIGHAFVTAASLATVFNVVTSTDFLTAILTHGLLLLIFVLALLPRLSGGSGYSKAATA